MRHNDCKVDQKKPIKTPNIWAANFIEVSKNFEIMMG
jgi:hypothetical protein